MDEGVRILELARNAQVLFERQPAREKRRLLNFLLSNCTWEDGEVVAIFRQPFDLLAETNTAVARIKAGNGGNSSKNEIWLQSPLSNIRDNIRHHVSVALNHPEYDGLVRRAATAFAASRTATNIGFVGFNIAVQRPLPVSISHVLADFVRHAPRRRAPPRGPRPPGPPARRRRERRRRGRPHPRLPARHPAPASKPPYCWSTMPARAAPRGRDRPCAAHPSCMPGAIPIFTCAAATARSS